MASFVWLRLLFHLTSAASQLARDANSEVWEGVTVVPQQAVEGGTDFPSVRYSHSAVVDAARKRMIVTHGYYYNHGRSTQEFQSDTWAFSFTDSTWSRLVAPSTESAPSARYCASMVVWRDAAYLFGGSSISGESFNDLWRFDLASDSWSSLAQTGSLRPKPRSLHACTVLGDKMYVLGGLDMDDMWYYDLLKDTWHEVPSTMEKPGNVAPGSRWGMQIAALDEEGFYMFGGVRRTGQGHRAEDLNDLWYFSTGEAAWKEVTLPAGALMPSKRRYASAVLHPNSKAFLLFGGADCETGCKCKGDLWKFDTSSRTWEEQSLQGKRPIAVYRQSLGIFEGSLYLFGGESYSPYMYHNSVMRFSRTALQTVEL